MVMLKRIKQIKNIGVFSDFSNGGSVGFEKLTFIYGLNTYGKTTIADIFQSLKNNDGSILGLRKTVPEKISEQKVVLVIGENENSGENELIFQKNSWGGNIAAENFEVFGAEFMHRNIFTGLTIQRGNKENFTQFILGEQGVKLAEQIKLKRKELSDNKKNLKNKIPEFINGKSNVEVQDFINMSIAGLAKDDIETELYQRRKLLKAEQERLEEPAKILNLQEPSSYEPRKNTVLENLSYIDGILIEDYTNIKEESLNKLNEHFSGSFSNQDNAENWIKEGLSYCKNQEKENCPFCGQNLSGAKALIELYNSYFDEAYNAFIARVVNGLNSKVSEIERAYFNEKSVLQTILASFNHYKNLIITSDFQADLQELTATIDCIQEEYLISEKNKLLIELKIVISNKIKAPHQKIQQFDFESFKAGVEKYLKFLTDSKKLIDLLIEKVNLFKNTYRDSFSVEKTIILIKKEITILEYKKARIDLDTACIAYKSLQEEIALLEKKISELDSQLEQEQSEYLATYFTEINKVFKKLGSGNFELENEIDSRGLK